MPDFRSEFLIGDAAEKVGVEIHTLRYWQKELNLPDRRNEMNQRVYIQVDIDTFMMVKGFREKEGLSLKAIKTILNAAGTIQEETSTDVATIDKGASIAEFKRDLLKEFDEMIETRQKVMLDEIDALKHQINRLEEERNKKLDGFIVEWRAAQTQKQKGLFQRLFNSKR